MAAVEGSENLRPVKIEITTYGYPYFRSVDSGKVQHLSINSYGHVKFSEFDKDLRNSKNTPISSEERGIGVDVANRLIYTVINVCFRLDELLSTEEYSSSEYQYSNTDGSWEVKIYDNLGNAYSFQGFYSSLDDIIQYDPSEFMREELDMDNLLAFDGQANKDRIERITISVDRTLIDEDYDDDMKFSTFDGTIEIHEKLSLDGKGMFIEYEHGIRGDFKSYRKVELGSIVKKYLNSLDVESFFMNFSDVSTKSKNTKNDSTFFRMELAYKFRDKRVISGSFDRKGLPTDWMDFSDWVSNILVDFSWGNIFSLDVMKKSAPDPGEVIYLSVRFKYSDYTYYYLTDDESIQVGDHVMVPVGSNNKEKEVVVDDVEYFKPEEVPYPLDRIKKVTSKL